ncbi:GNAT family protein [Daejeonella sp.]|uniref:GNAT family N-acetyltransferase n=1 Tax=Daejeonella sp. TaxID=2805397 RepID=UPI0030C22A8C
MIKLEYFTSADFDTLLDWVWDKELLVQWAGTQFRYPLTKNKLDWYIEEANNFDNSSTFVYKAVYTESGRTVGHISLTSINRKNRSARITRVLVGNSDRGKGIAEQMVKALMKIGFNQLNLHRMSLGVYDNNTSAIKCYKKCGFQVDGLLRDIQKHNNSYLTLMEMSILENEWVALGKVIDRQNEM